MNGAFEEAIGIKRAAASAGFALAMHLLSVRCCTHDMFVGLIEAVILYEDGQIALIGARAICVTCVEALGDRRIGACAISKDEMGTGRWKRHRW